MIKRNYSMNVIEVCLYERTKMSAVYVINMKCIVIKIFATRID